MSELFPKSTSKQRAHLIYGTKLRYIKCLEGNAYALQKLCTDAFTDEEMVQLKEISNNAIERAKKERDEALRIADTTTPSTNSRIAEESRQYDGK